jgi:uncharacterized membrane protein YfcA
MHELAFVLAGFFVGTIVGLTGVGGGSLMTPILIFFFDIKPYLAVGTDLLFAAFTKMGGTIQSVGWKHPGFADYLVPAAHGGCGQPGRPKSHDHRVGLGLAADGGRHAV